MCFYIYNINNENISSILQSNLLFKSNLLIYYLTKHSKSKNFFAQPPPPIRQRQNIRTCEATCSPTPHSTTFEPPQLKSHLLSRTFVCAHVCSGEKQPSPTVGVRNVPRTFPKFRFIRTVFRNYTL